jgi:hypothetical protein
MPPNLIDYRQRDPDHKLTALADAYAIGLIDENMVRQALDYRKQTISDLQLVLSELEKQRPF